MEQIKSLLNLMIDDGLLVTHSVGQSELNVYILKCAKANLYICICICLRTLYDFSFEFVFPKIPFTSQPGCGIAPTPFETDPAPARLF